MNVPTAAELAAIAAAYALVRSKQTPAPQPAPSRWRRAARIEAIAS